MMNASCLLRAMPAAAPANRTYNGLAVRSRAMLGRKQLKARAMMGGMAPGAGLSPEVRANIDKLVNSNKVVLFMKGTKQFPQCGFSNTVVQILNVMNVPFEHVNILADDSLRVGMKEYSQWPTFPQVYIGGEFVGGADILIEMFQSGELKELLERELNS